MSTATAEILQDLIVETAKEVGARDDAITAATVLSTIPKIDSVKASRAVVRVAERFDSNAPLDDILMTATLQEAASIIASGTG